MGQVASHISRPEAIAVGVPLLLGQLVGIVQGQDTLTWFKTLKKPAWCPPIPAFPAVWTALYACMGYASYLVWRQGGWQAQRGPLQLYAVQLALNLAWPIVYFKAKRLWTAQAVNLALLATAAATARQFAQVDPLAGKLFLPYLAWLALANALNFSTARANPSGADDPKLQRPRDSEGGSNPGEGRYGRPGTASACLAPAAQGGRGRARLQVFARSVQLQAAPLRPRGPPLPQRRAGPVAVARLARQQALSVAF